jgi:hypothetical protein
MREDETQDPQPGDFDEELEALDPRSVQRLDASPDAKLVVQLTVSAEEADILASIARQRGEELSDVLGSLIRNASTVRAP